MSFQQIHRSLDLFLQIYQKISKPLQTNINKIALMSQTSQSLKITQSKIFKLFDRHYGSRQKLDGFSSQLACMRNEYNHCQNPDGFINFGTFINRVIAKTTIEYLPKFMKLQDCFYPQPRVCDELNKKVCEGTKFQWNETFTFNNIQSILSLFCSKYKNVFILGKSHQINLEVILDHSQSEIVVNVSTADLVILFRYENELIKKIEQKSPNSVKLFVLLSKKEVFEFDPNKNNYVFVYQFFCKEALRLAILHTKDTKIKKNISDLWNLFVTSTVTRRASLQHNLKIDFRQTGTEVLRKMIETDNKVLVPKQNIWFTLGVNSGMDTIFRVLFKNTVLSIDSPFYDTFNNLFVHNNVKIVSNSILPNNKIIDRIKQSQSKGCTGYIICNPRNQDGTILKPQEVDQICQYVKNKQNFHLVFDETLLNTCFGNQTKSVASFAVQLPNVHVVRGIEKDFGLDGFRIGFVISSNPNIMKKFEEWKPIISHHPYTISVFNQMLRKSNYGTEIIKVGKQILRDYLEIVCSELDKQNISYKKPESGCYVLANLKQFMRDQTFDEQNTLWKKLFYKYRVNLLNLGTSNTKQFGYFRICPILDQQTMREGLKRLIIAIKDRQEQSY